MERYDLIIIGAGPGGYDTAATAATRGLRTLLIERNELGGTCLNCGCIPTKALRHTAHLLEECRSSAPFGVKCHSVTLHFAKAMEHKDDVVSRLREGIATLLAKVDIVKGEARFVDAHTVSADGHSYTAGRIIIATGSRPATIPIKGVEHAIDSTEMLSLSELPGELVVIGGGVIGMEFASIFSSFGVKVTVLEMASEILPGMDGDIAKRLRMLLKRRGINIITGAAVQSISDRGHLVTYLYKGKTAEAVADKVLLAVGRRAVLPEGIEATGVTIERGFISVDPHTMATGVDGIYAVGDVNGLCMLAHAARAQGLVALGIRQNLKVVPSVAFTLPECAMVGITAARARESGYEVLTGTAYYRANGKAVTEEALDGMIRITADASTRNVLGCHAYGENASMLVQEVATAMSCGATIDQLLAAIRSHPTMSELVGDALFNLH